MDLVGDHNFSITGMVIGDGIWVGTWDGIWAGIITDM
jgi:hypothetical protein